MAEAVDEVEELLQVDGIIEAGRGVDDVEDAGRLAEGAGDVGGAVEEVAAGLVAQGESVVVVGPRNRGSVQSQGWREVTGGIEEGHAGPGQVRPEAARAPPATQGGKP